MNPAEVFGKDYETFYEEDPFNHGNIVEGFISRKPNEYYGALIITRVNHEKVDPQLIMGSPKMHYPFAAREDGTRNYLFPSAQSIEVYEKLDGTNILAYYYYGPKNRYMSFKTRLRPFLKSGKYGDFLSMWKEVGSPHFDVIKTIMHDNNCNLSFEMYGSRNPILIKYDVLLAIAFLFGVTNTGRILSPASLGAAMTLLPVVPMLGKFDRDYVWNYEQVQQKLEAGLSKIEEEQMYTGVEGAVWYLHTPDGRCIQLKCKPETVELIHWSSSGLNKHSVRTTCWNAYENMDDPTLEFVKQLLLEEFDQRVIDLHEDMIRENLEFVKAEQAFRTKVLDVYRATGKNIILDKAGVMREISPHFHKKEMRKVYGIISTFG